MPRRSPLITVIGRGHGGTRAMSHTLLASDVYIGNRLNDAGDKLPPEAMYDASVSSVRTISKADGPVGSSSRRNVNRFRTNR